MKLYLGVLLSLGLGACGHYRGAGAYSGNGSWKSPSDYEQDPRTRDFYLRSERIAEVKSYHPSGEFRLQWPVQQVKVNRGFRPPSAQNHQGIDLGGPLNTPILAAHEGIVIYAGRDFRGYGQMIIVEYSKEWATLYGHLNEISVREGQIMRAGDPVGGMGRTGAATGIHLHFELLRNHQPVDPMSVLTHGQRIARRK